MLLFPRTPFKAKFFRGWNMLRVIRENSESYEGTHFSVICERLRFVLISLEGSGSYSFFFKPKACL